MPAKTKNNRYARRELAKDLFFIFVGAAIAIILSFTGAISAVTGFIGNVAVVSFVSGIFFTSAFTIAPASVALAGVAGMGAPLSIALWGALGAMLGDLALFLFIRDRFTDDLIGSIRPSVRRHILSSFHLGFMKWLAPLVGALIIFSPLPDEIGLTLLGLSRTRVAILMPLSFAMNFLAIYGIVWFAQAV